jgi:hypothetical protein
MASAPQTTPDTDFGAIDRYVQDQEVCSDLTHLFSLIEDVDDQKLAKLLKPIRSHLDDLLVPFEQMESVHRDLLDLMPEQIVDALALAWHYDHLSYQYHGKIKYAHQQQSQQWLDFAEGLLANPFEPHKILA